MRKPPVFAYQQPEENTGYLLWQVSMRWQLRMNQQLRTVGLTLTQFSLLAGLYWLDQQGEAVTQQRLADYANTDKMMTSKVLQTLAKKAWLSGSITRRTAAPSTYGPPRLANDCSGKPTIWLSR